MLKEIIINLFKDLDLSEDKYNIILVYLQKLKDNRELLQQFENIDIASLKQDLTSNIQKQSNSQTIFVEDPNSESQLTPDSTIIVPNTPLHNLNVSSNSLPMTINTNKIGRYIDLGMIGKGGMGEVRRVKDETLKRTMAMKVLHPKFNVKKTIRLRFTEEAQIGAQLQHPNIIPVYELGELPDGRQYFTMKEIKGIEFSNLIDKVHDASNEYQWGRSADGTDFRTLINIFHTICETIAYTHSMGVIHRDLKPDNIMIGDFGEVLICDWGIAKLVNEVGVEEIDIETERNNHAWFQTHIGAVTGTPVYMSPEQALGETHKIHFTSDIYTLGSILYEILSGIPPYTGTTADDVIEKVRTSHPPSLFQINKPNTNFIKSTVLEMDINGKMPNALIKICEHAMARNIEDRYQTAEKLSSDIKAWLDGSLKRESGLKEIQRAEKLQDESFGLKRQSEVLWNEADNFISQNKMVDTGWEIWWKSKEFERQSESRRLQFTQTVQGALVHDPELKEAHSILAELIIPKIISADINQDYSLKDSLFSRFESHINYVTNDRKKDLIQLLNSQLKLSFKEFRSHNGPLIGRKSILAKVKESISSGKHLISLTGTAGVGKTRIALEIISSHSEQKYKPYFCNLTTANDKFDILSLLSRSLDVHFSSEDPVDTIGHFLAPQDAILVLDNLEHIVEESANLIKQLFELAPNLTIVTTSRIKLNLERDVAIHIKPLSIIESIEMFESFGQRVLPHFHITPDNVKNICDLTEQLDRLPLAIELAASRMNMFSVTEIKSRLDSRFAILRTRDHSKQALETALEWSWDLLEPWEKDTLSKISLFRGGFSLDAAEQLIELSQWDNVPPIFDILANLCENSLLQISKENPEYIRFGVLTTIHQYASSKLKLLKSEKQISELSSSFASYYSKFGQLKYLDSLEAKNGPKSYGIMFTEFENLLFATENGSWSDSVDCGFALLKIYLSNGPIPNGVLLIDKLMKLEGVSETTNNKLKIKRLTFLRESGKVNDANKYAGSLTIPSVALKDNELASLDDETYKKALNHADYILELASLSMSASIFDTAITFFNQALELYKKLNRPSKAVKILSYLAQIHRFNNEFTQAKTILNTAFEITNVHELYASKATLHLTIGNLSTQVCEFDAALHHFNQALKLTKEMGDIKCACTVLSNLGVLHRAQGHPLKALSRLKQAIDMAETNGFIRLEALYHGSIANVYADLLEFDKSISHYKQSIEICNLTNHLRMLGVNQGNLGELYFKLNRYEEAKKSLNDAIKNCKNTVIAAAAHFKGCLALILAHENQTEKAMDLICEAESALTPTPTSLAKLHCKKAQIQFFAGDKSASTETMNLVYQHIDEFDYTQNSELLVLVRETLSIIEATES